MEYRLAALPAEWLASSAVMIEDQTGSRYLFDLSSGGLEPIDDRDSVLLMQWHDRIDSDSWQSLVEICSLAAAM